MNTEIEENVIQAAIKWQYSYHNGGKSIDGIDIRLNLANAVANLLQERAVTIQEKKEKAINELLGMVTEIVNSRIVTNHMLCDLQNIKEEIAQLLR
jgi:dsDNA-binding SOS-regulon protein